jgi:hypothetical protein
MRTLSSLTLLAALALPALAGGAAQAADPYVVGTPAVQFDTECSDAGVLRGIRSRFAYAERRTWRRGYVMDRLENPRPSGHPYAEPGIIARDYCVADAVMTNGDIRVVYYAVEHGVGFAGIGRYVDFCVLGLDPWHVHDGSCRTVR